MKRFAIAGLLAFSLATSTSVPAEGPGDTIEGVISSQIDALLADDFSTAFSFASPMIKSLFRTPDQFGAMVRNGYPMVWRPADVRFGALQEFGDIRVQTVFLTDQQGRAFEAAYEMIQTPEGRQINGVAVREVDLGA